MRNRCKIYGANGKLQLIIPKKRKGSNKTIMKDIQICYKQNWQREHWKSIVSAYNSSPYFKYYKDDFIIYFKKKEELLINLNHNLQVLILRILQEKIDVNITNKYLRQGNFTDLRDHNFSLKKQERYDQVFMEKYGFISNLSILDLLFNLGPESLDYLHNLDVNIKV